MYAPQIHCGIGPVGKLPVLIHGRVVIFTAFMPFHTRLIYSAVMLLAIYLAKTTNTCQTRR